MKALSLITALTLCFAITESAVKRSIEDDVIFELFTKSNTDTYSVLTPSSGSSLGAFSASRPTRILIHGWVNSADNMAYIKNDYLSVSDVNVILVDCLGAHIAGVAGSKVTKGKVGKITEKASRGLYDLDDRLDSGDASFVEVIHTCGGTLGILEAIGHADFYPNGGTPPQPGCSVTLGACSHGRSHEFFSESIVTNTGFYARKCDSFSDYEAGNCNSNDQAVMGENTSTSARGTYYLETGSSSPYALGK
ncbi:hypothetical protein L9F63_010710 [Diploptera punctata]|uniref:Lipase domain-containing protein n=1 Tax=Diploptera punctata TaxID=6984 RepID=A0AAD8AGF3_DIPPU|nr:hypothetical protein L9F63_010710 [Diploptera punctata]